MRITTKIIVLALFVMSATTAVFAQGRPPEGFGPMADPNKWSTLIATGPFIAPEFEGATDYRVLPMPFVRARKGNYFIQTEGPGLTANIVNDRFFNAGPSIRYRGERDDDVQNMLVKRLEPINSSIIVGGFISYSVPLGKRGERIEAKIKPMFDIGDAHNGYSVATSLTYRRVFGPKMRFGLAVNATYADENYNNTYFGVNASNALLGYLPTYSAGAGLKDVGANFNLAYSFNQNWGIIGIVSYKKLLDPAKNSPLIQAAGTTNQFFGTIGLSYRF